MFYGSLLLISLHQLPGRIRIRSPKIKDNIPLARNLESAIIEVFGIESVRTSTLTGSVLIYYNVKLLHPGPIFRELRKLKILDNVFGFPHSFPDGSIKVRLNKIECSPFILECLKFVGKMLLLMVIEQGTSLLISKIAYKII